ncbi:MAG: membrane protein insertase YidC [Myxococcota bacterium]|nr:membrane protein insertase YidC [Myxococcota bacterium]
MNREQDRRALLAVALSLGVWLIWSAFFAPEPPLPVQDGGAASMEGSDADVLPVTAPVDSAPVAAAAEPVSVGETVPFHEVAAQGDGFRGEVTSTNGTLTHLLLDGYSESRTVTPLYAWVIDKVSGEAEESWVPYAGGEAAHEVLSEDGAFVIAGAGAFDDDGGVGRGPGAYRVTKDGDTVIARRLRPDGLAITKVYTPGAVAHTTNVAVTFENRGNAPLKPWVGVADEMSGDAGRFMNAVRPVLHVDGSVEHLEDLDDVIGPASEVYDGAVEWWGVGDRYFFAVLVPDEPAAEGQLVIDDTPGGRIGVFHQGAALSPGDKRTVTYTAYSGPKDLDALKALGHQLEDAVEFGWFGFFAKILLFVLKLFQQVVVNWGVAIITLTIFVKLLFFPLTQKAFESSRKMQALQPKLNAMKEKFKDNKELQTQETMKLFKEHKVNPMGGCLPTLIQFPVWIALYNVMLYSVELYDTQFLYLQDLTEADPYGIVPTMYAVLMFLQQRMMPTASLDETQQKLIKMMPLVFAFFMYSFPSGLVLYFSVNMVLTIVQQWFIKRKFPDVPANAPAAT